MKSKRNPHNKNYNKKKRNATKQRKSKLWQILILIAIILAIVALSIKPNFNESSGKRSTIGSEPMFKKEGVLTIHSKNSDQIIRTIDIEIAETNRVARTNWC